MRSFLFVLLSFILLWGCSVNDDQPDKLLPEETYINLLVEMQLLRSYQKQHQPDSAKMDSMRTAIFEEYNVTGEQFRISHEYYQQNIDQQRERIREAIERLRKDWISGQDTTANKADSVETDSATIDS